MKAKTLTLASYETKIIESKETGEITEVATAKTYKAQAEPSYIKMYLEDLTYLNRLPKGIDAILFELLKYINYEHQIYINSHLKRKIAKEIGKTEKHINNSITKLVKAELLIRVDRGVYEINSYIFGRGSWKDILKHRRSLKLEVFYSYKEGRREIRTETIQDGDGVLDF